MKIAFLVESFPSISETFILNQIIELINQGNDVEIFAQHKDDSKIVDKLIEKYKLLDKTHYFGMPENRFYRSIKSVTLFMKYLQNAPLPVLRSLNFLKYGSDALSLRAFYMLLEFIKIDNTFDIIHAHFGPNGKMAILLKDMLHIKGKVVTSFHGNDISAVVKAEGENVYNYLFERGNLFLANSDYTKEKLHKLGCPKEKIKVLPVGLNLSDFKYKVRKIEDKIKIITIARLYEKKGLKYSIKAVAKLIKKYPNLEYNIIGNGPLKSYLQKLIMNLKAQDKIKLLGWQKKEKLIEYMEESHIFVLASVTAKNGDEEGQGLVLQESQAMGMPVVSTYHNGIPEGILDQKSGFLVPEKDIDALSKKIEYLINNPKLWKSMGEEGREFIERKYDIKKINQKLVEIYKDLID